MRAAVTTAPGGPTRLETVDDPTGDILVAVRAAVVGPFERSVRAGTSGLPTGFPLVQGSHAAGVVVRGRSSIPTGLRVVTLPRIACGRCRFCRGGRPADCESAATIGADRFGGVFAEVVSVPRQNLMRLPDEVGFAEGAAAVATHAVVLRALREAGRLPLQPTTLVTGAGTPLGVAAIQVAHASGHVVIAVAHDPSHLEPVGRLGVSCLVDASTEPAFSVPTRDLLGRGVDIAVETTGSPAAITEATATLAAAGMLVAAALPLPGSKLDLSALAVVGGRLSTALPPSHEDIGEALRMVADGRLDPLIGARRPLADIDEMLGWDLISSPVGTAVVELPASDPLTR